MLNLVVIPRSGTTSTAFGEISPRSLGSRSSSPLAYCSDFMLDA